MPGFDAKVVLNKIWCTDSLEPVKEDVDDFNVKNGSKR